MTKPSAPSVALRYAAARVAASPFSELSPEGAEAFGAFCRSLTYWLGMAQYGNLDDMYRVWKGSKELQGWLSRHVNKSSYTLYYGRRLTQSDVVGVGDTLSRKGRGKVLQWTTRPHTAAWFAALDVVNPPGPPDLQGAMGEAKVNGEKVIVDVDRFIAFCTRHKQDAAPMMVNSQAIELLTSGEDFEGEVLTTPVNATVIRAEFYQKGKTASLTAKIPASVLYDKGRGGWEYGLGGFADWPSFRKKPKREQVAWAKEFVGSGGQIREPVDISVYSDGGVKFEDGHHRVIAGALLDLDIPVRVRFINFDKELWPDLLTLLKAGYTRRQYNPQDWKLKGSGVPPLDVVRRGPDAADEWIMSNERVKTAARPLRLDRSAVNRLLDDLYKQVERSSSGRSRRELGYGWLAESTFTVTTPKGDRREVIVELNTVPMKPSFRGVVVKGGYGYIKGKDDLKVSLTLNGSLTPDQFLNRRRTEKEIRAAMMHELTHASEVKGTLADLKGGSAYDYQDEPHAYHNDPHEVRAWMRQVYEEIREDPRAGVMPIEVLLENNRWWKQAEPHLTRKSRNRILKGLVTAFEDEGIEVRPTRKTAARPIRLPTREIKTLAKRLAQRLYRYGLPKPGRVIAQEYLPLTNVKGDEVVVEIWLTGTPGWNHDPFGSKLLNGGSFRRRPEGPLPLILMYVNPHLDPRTFEMRPRRIVEDELYRLLAHELTHAADIWLGKGSVGDLSGSRDDLKKHHHNHPAEVKALMRDVVTHLDDGDVVREFMGYGMDFNTALREALKDTKWPEIEPYLTPRNKKSILKGVYTFLQDQGLDEVTR